MRHAAKGDEDAFTVLYRRHQAALYRFALRMTGNAWASEEIVQDVFMTLMREPTKYDPGRGTIGRLSLRDHSQSRHETSGAVCRERLPWTSTTKTALVAARRSSMR